MKMLQGKASDILKDFIDDKYEMEYFHDIGRCFKDTKTGEHFLLSEEVNYYMDEVEIIWGMMFDGYYVTKKVPRDNDRWSGDTW